MKGKSLGSNHHELEPFFGLLRTDLQEVRIIQTNLVFLNGLDAKLSKEEVISESFMSEKWNLIVQEMKEKKRHMSEYLDS